MVSHVPGKPSPPAIITGLSPRRLLVAGTLIALGLWLHGWIGLLLLVAGTDMVMSRWPFALRPICWPALGFAAVGMLVVDPAVAFACGWLVELVCDPAMPAPDSAADDRREPEAADDESDPGDRL